MVMVLLCYEVGGRTGRESGVGLMGIEDMFNSASLNRHLARTYNLGNGVNFVDRSIEWSFLLLRAASVWIQKSQNRKFCEYMFSRDIHCYLFPDNIFAIQQWCSNNVPHAKEQLAHVYGALLQPAILEFHQQSRLHGTSLWVSYNEFLWFPVSVSTTVLNCEVSLFLLRADRKSENVDICRQKNKKLKWRSKYKQKKSIASLLLVLTTRTLFRCIAHKCCRFERQTGCKRRQRPLCEFCVC
ncbi:hypothetical protein MKW98_020514 [Papaver atlanticum]|uniref:Uncharacterized protein n=1 Tax=Papaver atlanticum TaxID=357466 RepID=A0AAD4SQE2_9MAGN|nr:hypothetical protein MKW98_020514 [Papaver atlanticum]